MIERTTKFTLSERDVVKATSLASARKLPVPIWAILVVGAFVALVVVLLPGTQDNSLIRVAVPVLVVLLLATAFLQYLIVPWQAKRHARQSAALRDEITLEWDAERMRLRGDRGNIDFAWSDFHRWSENDHLLLLYHSELLFNAVPQSALSNLQHGDIVNALTVAGVKKR